MRVITFSRTFPDYHRRKGQPTHFVEKILNLQWPGWRDSTFLRLLLAVNDRKIKEGKLKEQQVIDFYCSLNPSITEVKMHTIRAGYRWKEGDITNAAVWSGRPYHTPQIIFTPDIELKKVWEFDIKSDTFPGDGEININGKLFTGVVAGLFASNLKGIIAMAANDGLEYTDFLDWFQFPKPFDGQILCWDERINY